MKKTLLFLCLITAGFGFSQTNWTINAGTMTWSPSSITIDEGDSVTWVSVGSHSLNGTTALYPSNPESFSHGAGTNWVFGKRFNIAGTYNFRCDVHPTTMTGVITVNSSSGINELNQSRIKVFPNPAKDVLTLSLDKEASEIIVKDLSGKVVLRTQSSSSINISQLNHGIYVIEAMLDDKAIQGRFIKE